MSKNVGLADKGILESFVACFPPYSDFNFTSLWAWDISDKRKVSVLHENLVVEFTDYGTGNSFYSVLGTNQIANTVATVIEHSLLVGLPNSIQLVPRSVAELLDQSNFVVEEDRDNFDYIYSVSVLSSYDGSHLQGKRYKARKFERRNPQVSLKILDYRFEQSWNLIFDLIGRWQQNKIDSQKECDVDHERLAISRLSKVKDFEGMKLLALCSADECFGFMVLEILPQNFAICHFWKCDDRYAGVYDYLINQVAKLLLSLGIEHFNFEQDLGLQNLRAAKLGYRPVKFLKKYRVSLRE